MSDPRERWRTNPKWPKHETWCWACRVRIEPLSLQCPHCGGETWLYIPWVFRTTPGCGIGECRA